jgi:transcriptional regulator with XRE-family HTH domain
VEAKTAFAIVIRRRRLATGKSQEEFAFDADLDRTFLSHIERGLGNATIPTLLKLAKALEVAPHKLVMELEIEMKKAKPETTDIRIKRPNRKTRKNRSQ